MTQLKRVDLICNNRLLKNENSTVSFDSKSSFIMEDTSQQQKIS